MPPPKFSSSAHSSIKKRKSKRSLDYGNGNFGSSSTSLGAARSAPVTPTSDRSSSKVWYIKNLDSKYIFVKYLLIRLFPPGTYLTYFLYLLRMEVLKLFQKDLGGQAMEAIMMEGARRTVTVIMDLMALNGLGMYEIRYCVLQ